MPVTSKYVEQIFLEYRDPVVQYMNYGPPENLQNLLAEKFTGNMKRKRRGEQCGIL